MPQDKGGRQDEPHSCFRLREIRETEDEQAEVKHLRARPYGDEGLPDGWHLGEMVREGRPGLISREAPPNEVQDAHADRAGNPNQGEGDAHVTEHVGGSHHHLGDEAYRAQQYRPMGKINRLLAIDKVMALGQQELADEHQEESPQKKRSVDHCWPAGLAMVADTPISPFPACSPNPVCASLTTARRYWCTYTLGLLPAGASLG